METSWLLYATVVKQVPNLAYSAPAGSTLPPVDPIQPETGSNGVVCKFINHEGHQGTRRAIPKHSFAAKMV
jgi:hypothetical protein